MNIIKRNLNDIILESGVICKLEIETLLKEFIHRNVWLLPKFPDDIGKC